MTPDPVHKTDDGQIINWVQSGHFHTINAVSAIQHEGVIAHFNPCSMLPLVPVTVLSSQLSAIVDTGAVRSLLSTSLSTLLWGNDWQTKVSTDVHCRLHDVNNKPVKVLGTMNITFSINVSSFTHTFIIYESLAHELLLGFDFLKHNKIAVCPNLGLVLEAQGIFRLGYDPGTIFKIFLLEEVTLQAGAQQVVSIQVQLQDEQSHMLPILANKYVVAHSEEIESDLPFDQLSLFFQYIWLSSTLQSQVLLINHSPTVSFISRSTIIGHVEPLEKIAHVQEIATDPLINEVYNCVQISDDKTINPAESRICLDHSEDIAFDPSDINCHIDNPAHVNWLKALHSKYEKIFTAGDFEPGLHIGSSVDFSVRTKATIIHQRYRKVNPAILTEAQEIIQMLLNRGLVELSNSPWSSQILFVLKGAEEKQVQNDTNFIPGEKIQGKKRKLRVVLDLRHVNLRLKELNTNWIVPSIWSLLGDFHSAKYVSTIDLNSGFWHFKLSEKAKKLTAFAFEDITLQCTRMPQGLKISSAVMQSKMRKFIIKYGLMGTSVYIDNLIVQAPTAEKYKERLTMLFQACLKDGFKIRNRKSHHFIHKAFVIFGFEIDLASHTIKPEREKVDKIQTLAVPHTKKRVRTFIGAVSYFQNMLPLLQKDLTPLHEIAAPNTKFKWTEDCNSAFIKIKRDLAKLPIVYIFQPNLQIHFFCDAAMSSHVAYCLYQFHSIKEAMVPIKFNSHKLSPSERKFSQYECEALALIFAILKEESLLSFGNSTLYTDARSLTFITRFATATSKISRWDILLKSFDVRVQFLPNSNALIKVSDLLTRGLEKSKFKNKVTEQDVSQFIQLDFGGLPTMGMHDAMCMIQKALALVDKATMDKKMLSNVKMVFPDTSFSVLLIGPDRKLLCLAPGHLVAQVVSNTEFVFSPSDTSKLESIPPQSTKTITWTDQIFDQAIKVKEAIYTFMPHISQDFLIRSQKEEKWIVSILNKLNDKGIFQNYFLYEGILMRKFQLQNSIYVNQIVLPESIGTAVIKRFHAKNCFQHLGALHMMRHISQVFYIRKFMQLADTIIQACTFCMLNKPYPNKRLSPGLKIHISAPRQFIYLDICCVQSSAQVDSFLTIVDGFSRFVMFLPISRDAPAIKICEIIFAHWIRNYSFPIVISTDGGSNLSNSLTGEISMLLNCKMVKIAPYNSSANLSERYNKMALASLRIFHQSYGLTEANFDLLLSLTGQMLNSQLLRCGYSPYFLHTGSHPKLNDFVSLQSLQVMTGVDQYVKSLVQVQNVCFVLNEMNTSQEQAGDHEIQHPDLYKKGGFVLLKKLSPGTPRHLHKVKTVYHKQIFRILRRTKTNAVIFPFNKKFYQNRFKREGKIPKQYCSIQRISNLKPIRNVYKLLNLSVSQKMIIELSAILNSEIPPVEEVQICENKAIKITPASVVKKFNPSLQIVHTESNQKPMLDKVMVEQITDCSEIQDINNVKMQTYYSDLGIPDTSQNTLSVIHQDATTICKLDKKKKPVPEADLLSDCSSFGKERKFSFEQNDSYFSMNAWNMEYEEESDTEDRSDSSQSSIVSVLGTPQSNHSLEDEVETVRPALSVDRPVMAKTITRVPLPSGNTLSIISKPFPRADDVASRTNATPVSVKSNPRPRSLITDINKK